MDRMEEIKKDIQKGIFKEDGEQASLDDFSVRYIGEELVLEIKTKGLKIDFSKINTEISWSTGVGYELVDDDLVNILRESK